MNGSVMSFFTSHQKCNTPSAAIAYTSRCRSCQRLAPRRFTIALVEVTASGMSSTNALKPTVMKGRLATSLTISLQSKNWSSQM